VAAAAKSGATSMQGSTSGQGLISFQGRAGQHRHSGDRGKQGGLSCLQVVLHRLAVHLVVTSQQARHVTNHLCL